MERLSLAACTLVALCLLASPTLAVDGVKLIGQPRSFPVTVSAPGSYRLKSNLAVPDANTTAILVTVDDVTIDLNGFAIVGPTSCSGTPVTSCAPTGSGNGIDATGRASISVKNGRIRGVGNAGILLDSGSVDHVNVVSNGGNGIEDSDFFSAKTLVRVGNSAADSNGGRGILGAWTVVDSTAVYNLSDGFYLPVVVSNCSAMQNGGVGIAGYGNLAAVTNSSAYFNVSKGIIGFVVTNSIATANGDVGIQGSEASGCAASTNSVAQIQATGVTGHNLCNNAPCP